LNDPVIQSSPLPLGEGQGEGKTDNRVIGHLGGETPGASLILVGGIHGNEPAGILAMRRVLDRLTSNAIPIRGEMVALAGNVGGLAAHKRYLARDLNRLWSPAELAAAEKDDKAGDPEYRELRDLRTAVDRVIEEARGDVYCVDLHSTSARGGAFAVVRDTPANARFAGHFPLTVILGLAETLKGVLTEYAHSRGCRAMAVEGGLHDAAETIDTLEAAVWLSLSAAAIIPDDLREVSRAYEILDRSRGSLPRILEVVSRHAVEPDHQFRMEPGFANIALVRSGQLLAHDRNGPIRAPEDGFIMLPLYQSLGSDGFFLGRKVDRWKSTPVRSTK
jgi:predicted deacylase